MWRFRSAWDSDGHPLLRSLNGNVGRQVWVWDPEAGTPEERARAEELRRHFTENRQQHKSSSDELLRCVAKGGCGVQGHWARLGQPASARTLCSAAIAWGCPTRSPCCLPCCRLQCEGRRTAGPFPVDKAPLKAGAAPKGDTVTAALRNGISFYEGLQVCRHDVKVVLAYPSLEACTCGAF